MTPASALAGVAPTIAWMVLLAAAAWWVRRRGWVGPGLTRVASRATIDVLFPCLVFAQLAATVTPATFGLAATLSVWAVGMLVVTGWLADRALRRVPAADHRSAVFCSVMPNWIFLPLAIAGPLVGEAGVTTVILFNVPMQLLLWTAGVGYVRDGGGMAAGLKELVRSPGLLAAVAGIAVGLLTDPDEGWNRGMTRVMDGIGRIGWATIPVSLIALGCQLAETGSGPGRDRSGDRAVLVLRLVVLPLAAGAAVMILSFVPGLPSTADQRLMVYIIAAMPVAVTCPVFLARFRRDATLAARSVSWTTLAALVTAPLVVLVLGAVDRWWIPSSFTGSW